MYRTFTLVLLLSLSGCATYRPKFKCTKVLVLTPTTRFVQECVGNVIAVDQQCRGDSKHLKTDYGEDYPRGYLILNPNTNLYTYYIVRITGCWQPKHNTVWLKYGYSQLLWDHEFCHAAGSPERYCADKYPAVGDLD